MGKKYLKFKLIEKKPKTNVYSVFSIMGEYSIGKIKWYPAWRKYCFFPNAMTIWDSNCLIEVVKQIAKLMKERKSEKNG